jgi:subtilisin family serine protease
LHILNNIPGPLVILNAFRTYEPMPEVLEVIQAGQKQFLVLAASGNDGGLQAANPGRYSLAADNVLCVTSVKPDWALSSFGNIGTGVQLATLGEDLLSTYLNNRYAVGSGTSFSAALVAGLAGLVWAEAAKRGIGASPQFIGNCLLRGAELDLQLLRFFNLSYLRDAVRVWTEVERPVEPARTRAHGS